jgi:hypothetical protein
VLICVNSGHRLLTCVLICVNSGHRLLTCVLICVNWGHWYLTCVLICVNWGHWYRASGRLSGVPLSPQTPHRPSRANGGKVSPIVFLVSGVISVISEISVRSVNSSMSVISVFSSVVSVIYVISVFSSVVSVIYVISVFSSVISVISAKRKAQQLLTHVAPAACIAFVRRLQKVIVLNMLLGLAMHKMVDNWGHLGGLLGGAVAAWWLGPNLVSTDVNPQTTGPNLQLTETNHKHPNQTDVCLLLARHIPCIIQGRTYSPFFRSHYYCPRAGSRAHLKHDSPQTYTGLGCEVLVQQN